MLSRGIMYMANEGKDYFSKETIENFSKANVVTVRDTEGRPVLFVRSDGIRKRPGKQLWRSIVADFNREFQIEGEPSFYGHVVRPIRDDEESGASFEIIANYLFRKIPDPISGQDLYLILGALDRFFSDLPGIRIDLYRIGMLGELLVLLYLRKAGWTNVLDSYHTKATNRHDFEVSPRLRLEVKATVEGATRIHSFSHSQLVRKDCLVIVASCLLEESDKGPTLKDLFDEALADSSSLNAEAFLALEAARYKCALTPDAPGPGIARERAESLIRFFDSRDLPHLEIPDDIRGVSDIHYRVDCNQGTPISVEEVLGKVRSEIGHL